MNIEELKQELKKKYGHVIGSKQIETAAEHFGKEIDEVNEAPDKWSVISLLRMAKYDKESGVASTFIMKLTGYKGGVLVVKAPVYGTIKVTLHGERLVLLQSKPRELLKRVVECVEYTNEYDPYDDGLKSEVEVEEWWSRLESNRSDNSTLGLQLQTSTKSREVLLAELKERVPLLVANDLVKFTLVERKYVSAADGRHRRVEEARTPIEFKPEEGELKRGHERAASMRIHAGKTAAELKKPLKGEKLWTYRYHSCR